MRRIDRSVLSWAALASAGLLAPRPALALQSVDVRDGVAVEAIVSSREPTRLRIADAAITEVFGNIHSSGCASATTAPPTSGLAALPINPSGELIVECDRDKGEVYLRPVGESTKPINLFVSSARATYTLLLRRADVPADTIVLRDRSQRAPVEADRPPAGSPSANHVRALKALLVAMASDRVPADLRVEEVDRPLQLWAGTRFTLLRLYDGRGLVGEAYRLVNIGTEPIVLAEPEFDREGGQVLGVAVEQHELRPGEATAVFVIRRAE
jgi:conjugal transfer pilus assembly protein TraK